MGIPWNWTEEMDSTNEWAKRDAKNGAPSGAVYIADSQTQGKGRIGRRWETPKGSSLALSLLLRPDFEAEHAPMLTLVMGMAACMAIEKITGLTAEIKWPNDVVINKKKTTGILTEMGMSEGKISYVVVGIGINLNMESFPEELVSIYFCAGFPTLEGTASTIKVLEKKGINMIEIGIPFSDPMADGPVIQHAATRALKNGMTLKLLFDQLKDIRKEVQIPLVLMGYLNPIMQYGFKDFCRTCRETGIDGVIIPDLPFKDYMEEYRSIAEEQDVRIIMLITPETSEERIRLIDEHTDGFIYMVSSAAITGAQKDFNAQKQAYFQRIADMNLRNPRMIGFGISNKQTFETASAHAAGAIIGSKFVTLLDEEDGDTEKAADKLLEALKN